MKEYAAPNTSEPVDGGEVVVPTTFASPLVSYAAFAPIDLALAAKEKKKKTVACHAAMSKSSRPKVRADAPFSAEKKKKQQKT